MKKAKGAKPIPVRIVHDGPSEVASPYRPKDSMHMSVRQINNGFIVNKHGHKDGKHFDDEFYTPHEPKIHTGRGSTKNEPTKKPPAPSRKTRGVNESTKL